MYVLDCMRFWFFFFFFFFVFNFYVFACFEFVLGIVCEWMP